MTDAKTLVDVWLSAERDGDAQTTDRLLTDDFVGVGPLGFELPKAAWLRRMTGGDLRYDSLSLDERRLRTYGDCAIAVCRWNAAGAAGGHPIPEAARLTVVCVRAGGDWRIASIHYSFIAGTAGAPGVPR